MQPSIDEYSGGYLKTRLKTVVYQDGPAIQKETADYINSHFYHETLSEPIYRLGLDNNPHFKVNAEISIPSEVIGIPQVWFDKNDSLEENTFTDVYIVKSGQAHIMQEAQRLSERFSSSKDDTHS